MVRWLGYCTLTALAQVQPLVMQLRSCKLHGTAKNRTQTNQNKKKFIHQIKLIIALITALLWIVVGIKLVNIRKR